MSWLGRGALLISCAAVGCADAGDGLSIGQREPAHPALVGAASGEAGNEGEGGKAGHGSAIGEPGRSVGGDGPDGGAPTSCPQDPWVLASDIVNARDVGGTPLSQGGSVTCGSIFRGPPLALTTTGCDQARALGLRTVVDLRVDFERSARPDSTCTGADFLLAPLPIPYGLAAADYLADLNAETMATVFHAFGDPERYPIYFHCTWGRDRTGVVAAVLLRTLGVSQADVMAEYMLSQAKVGAYPNALQAVLAEIDARGGPESFLTSIGISPEEIAVMRSRATN